VSDRHVRHLAAQEVFDLLDDYVSTYVGDGVGEGDLLGAGFYTVLGVAALLNSAVSSEGAKTFFLEHLASGVIVEELDLGYGGGADKVRVFVELRTDFHAAGAGDAIGEGIVRFLLLREYARAGAKIVGAIDGNPCLDAHEVLKQDGAVDLKIADERELGKRFDLDGLLEIINQRRAGHAGFAVNAHCAGAADLLKTVGVVGDGGRRLAVGGDGIGRDLHHGGDDVHALTPLELEVFPHCR